MYRLAPGDGAFDPDVRRRRAADPRDLGDHDGHEVDLISEHGTELNTYEIKLNKVFSADFIKGLDFFDSNIKVVKTMNVIYGGDISQKIEKISLISWKDIA